MSDVSSITAPIRNRRSALSPYAVTGDHDAHTALPAPVIDAIHRIRTDPGRITRRMYDELVPEVLDDERYVELVGIVTLVVTLDAFAAGIGAEPWPLPEASEGEPTRVRSPAKPDEAWVPMVARADAVGEWAFLYDQTKFVPNVARALSLVPDQRADFVDVVTAQYLPLGLVSTNAASRVISRAQAELLATRVSALNECFY